MVVAEAEDQEATLRVRGYDEKRDWARAEALERRCQVGPSSDRISIFIDTLGDPICRIRNSPSYIMLVAELGKDLVGVIQGTIKVVAVPRPPPRDKARAGYILGLRVLPEHRCRGIASALVRSLEQWFVSNHVDFSYMATEETNLPSLRLFVGRLGYVRFRTPSIVVYPVNSRRCCFGYDRTPSNVDIRRLETDSVESIYRRFVSTTYDFFPDDIDRILKSKLTLGTWAAHFRDDVWQEDGIGSASWRAPGTWAVLSVWDTSRVFKLRLGNAPLSFRLLARCKRVINNILSCIGMQGIPDVFSPFGFYFIYGIHGEGRSSGELIKALCRHVQGMAGESEECRALVTEVGAEETGIQEAPRWKSLSCPRDVWCIKSLKPEEEQVLPLSSTPVRALFVDPREV
ncbi:hypothetical protein MLD38_011513 [Melastoma candidum]|uniref:Uncharacterized protein n=1 Tax=Melastoma candidum TaxID=119954 RepID=A0ACB9R7F4_9MYRT|nr:hypothetical protein MLD38_011513 [Melastoma candidum]